MLKYLRIAAVLAVALDFICPSHGFLTGDSEAGAIVPGNVAIATPVAPSTSSISTTPQMMGLGYAGEFTPRGDGIALIQISGTVANNTAGDGASLQIVYGQGAAPGNLTAFTGTSCGAGLVAKNSSLASSVSTNFPFTLTCIATGMQLGAPYWIDMAAAQTTGGAVTFTNMTVLAAEQ